MITVVVGDIGGTNSRLMLLKLEGIELKEVYAETILSHSCQNFIEVLHKFLDGKDTPRSGIFAVAGQSNGSSARFDNMGWGKDYIFANQVQTEFGIEKVVFLNDFEAAGYGCLELKTSDYTQINPDAEPESQQRKIVMGPGTGLGEALLAWNGTAYTSYPGEGGYSDFAAHNNEQWEFAKFMMNLVQTSNEYKDFRPCEGVCMEICLAGIGAFHIYNFFKQKYPELARCEFDDIWESNKDDRLKNMMIEGFTGRDELCKKSVKFWLQILAYECGNLIAKNLPFGGLYLIGGLVMKNYDFILENREFFIKCLMTKPRHVTEDVIRKVPIYVVKNEDVGMLGTIWWTKKFLGLS